jgi:predicted lipid-binding transport protein (Tim44 family)
MRNPKRRPILMIAAVFAFLVFSQIALESYVDARAGGGRSGGFRGSRTYQAPSRPSQPGPSQQGKEATPPPQQPSPFAPQSGGFMRGLAGGIMGGLLGSLLFSGLAQAGWGGLGGSGIGVFEILIVAGLGYFLIRKFRASARVPAPVTGYDAMQYQDSGYASGSTPLREEPPSNDIDYRTIQMMDRNFNSDQFLKIAQDLFFKIQGAWNQEDTTTLRSLCGSELMQTWDQELASLRGRGQKNRMDNVALRESEITEAWTESGIDYITVRLHANLLDFTVDEKSGAVVQGSNSDPVEFEEFWTFSRPVGHNPWILTAVQQA